MHYISKKKRLITTRLRSITYDLHEFLPNLKISSTVCFHVQGRGASHHHLHVLSTRSMSDDYDVLIF
uniref:Uncharacterized protein n=1 Tax=Oryza brachyantha TaxID=4533 RepID=J3LPD3_ORYBR